MSILKQQLHLGKNKISGQIYCSSIMKSKIESGSKVLLFIPIITNIIGKYILID